MASRTSQMVVKLDAAHALDLKALLAYASVNVPGFPLSPSDFTVSKSIGVISETLRFEEEAAREIARVCSRRRERVSVLRALGVHTQVPVPKAFCLCTDPSYLDGRIFVDPKLPGMAPDRRRAIYRATARTLASMHSTNVDAIGLRKYGRLDNYCKRQIERWAKQYIASTAEGKPERNPKMLELANWLRQHIPVEDSSGAKSGLVHGDFRIDNLVFHPNEDRVIGILDWELSTLGNQMCDVAYSCLHYIVGIGLGDGQHPDGMELAGIPEGIPSQAEYLAEYCHAARKQWPVAEWKFYVAFSLFRGASIYAGVYNRWTMGNASGGKQAQHTGKIAKSFIDSAWAFIQRQSVLPEHPPSDPIAQEYLKLSGNENENQGILSGGGRFVPSKRVLELRNRLIKFMEDHIYPMENEFYKLAQSTSRWTVHPEEEKLKELAKKEGLWNLFIPVDSAVRARKLIFDGSNHALSNGAYDQLLGEGLSNLEYGYLCEIMGRSVWAPQVFNCGAPDTGNMEINETFRSSKVHK
ncbi:probable acyl-CoA dehydrogenase IBR3 [Fagus crenata]